MYERGFFLFGRGGRLIASIIKMITIEMSESVRSEDVTWGSVFPIVVRLKAGLRRGGKKAAIVTMNQLTGQRK